MNRDKELIKLLKNLAGISEGCKPRMSIEQVKKEIKALYKPLGKEELVKAISKFSEWARKQNQVNNLQEKLAQAIINARGER